MKTFFVAITLFSCLAAQEDSLTLDEKLYDEALRELAAEKELKQQKKPDSIPWGTALTLDKNLYDQAISELNEDAPAALFGVEDWLQSVELGDDFMLREIFQYLNPQASKAALEEAVALSLAAPTAVVQLELGLALLQGQRAGLVWPQSKIAAESYLSAALELLKK